MRVIPIKTWEFVHICTLSAYTLVISCNISVHDYECLSSCASAGVKLCSEKTLDIPFLAYYGCSKLVKARAVFYWGTRTRFTVSVGLDAVLEVPIVYPWTRELELVLYGKLYITRIRASYTWQYVKRNILLRFYGISHACANSGAQAVFPSPAKNCLGTRLGSSMLV